MIENTKPLIRTQKPVKIYNYRYIQIDGSIYIYTLLYGSYYYRWQAHRVCGFWTDYIFLDDFLVKMLEKTRFYTCEIKFLKKKKCSRVDWIKKYIFLSVRSTYFNKQI